MDNEFIHARVSGINILYLMKNNTCVIGRDVNSKVDLTITSSPCISRMHLKLISKDNRLFLKCFGKNGIFINESFQVYTLDEVPLPALSTIRFPSTNIELQIESRNYLMENSNKKFPLKKRLFMTNKDSDSLGIDENYLSESSVDATELLSQRNHRMHLQNSSDMIVHSPTDQGTETVKPPYSYAQLIIQAIVSEESQQMTLSEIYRYISKNFPYYKMNQKGWQNSIRHNLSLNRYFIRIPRSHNNCGKSAFWKLDKSQEAQLIKQAFWKRRMKNAFVIVNKPANNNNNNNNNINSNNVNNNNNNNSNFKRNANQEHCQSSSSPLLSPSKIIESNSSIIMDQSTLSNDSVRNTEVSMYYTSFDI